MKQYKNMTHTPNSHHRRTIRLRHYDYSQPGAYFITICTHNRKCVFGAISDGKIQINPYGDIVHQEWVKTAAVRKNIELDEFIIMPNHVHGIIIIHDCRGTARRAPTMECFGKPIHNSIPTIVRSFKSAVTKQINALRQTPAAQVWQRNYYEHIIRNEAELTRVREYIRNNPLNWTSDEYYVE